MKNANDPAPPSHVELIFQQIGSLPTLSPVAVRIMRLAESGEADLREISKLIESDPAMSTKVLALCRRAELGLSNRITTVDRAVVMLGLEAVRAALLSVEIHEAFSQALEKPGSDQRRRSSDPPPAFPAFDRREMWRHCLAVASASELIVEANRGAVGGFSGPEAFLAGLLHDLGKLALDAVLPKSFERVALLAQERRMNIAEVERRVIGLDHHAAGKRLAEHWGLPHALLDVMWLHNQPANLLPEVPHRVLISVVTVADAIARRLHLGWSGNFTSTDHVEDLCRQHGLDPSKTRQTEEALSEHVAQRCRDVGLDDATPTSLLLECIGRANGQLGRVSAMVDLRAREGQKQARALSLLGSFLSSDEQRKSFSAALEGVFASARECLGSGSYALVVQHREGAPWIIHRSQSDGRSESAVEVSPPDATVRLGDIGSPSKLGTKLGPIVSWLGEKAGPNPSGEHWRMIPLVRGGLGLSAVLLHDRPDPEQEMTKLGLETMASAWGVAISSASRHDGARRLSEQLADANRRVSEAQAKLVEQRSMLRLGEMAAGAAHEMNNPLTVISGMSQSIVTSAKDADTRTAASAIVSASEKLSELITSLHLFADPPAPKRTPTDVTELAHQAVRLAKQRLAGAPVKGRSALNDAVSKITVVCPQPVPAALIDRRQIALALTELIVNALQATPRRLVEVRVHIDPFDDRLLLSVTDDGVGMSTHALEHACDPFFSELPAGRRTGLGLTRARRFADLHGGELILESAVGKGTTVRMSLPDWRVASGSLAAGEAA